MSETPMMTTAADCTSPWTELYQASDAATAQAQDAQRAFEQECQEATHDALSAIYNRV